MAKPIENKVLFNYGSDQMVKDAGSLSFFTPIGTKDLVDEFETTNTYTSTHYANTYGAGGAVPGICVVDYDLVPGLSVDGTSAINIASKKLYTFVRHQNSGSRNYDSPDLMNFAFSAVSLFTFMAEVKRAYGVCLKYSAKNRYYGERVCKALGFDYGNLTTNLADFRAWYNLTVKKLNAIKVPATWPMWTKNYLLNSIMVKDGSIDRSQIYAMRNCVLWKYNETGSHVGNLTPVFPFGQYGDTLLTLATLKSTIETLINAFVASEDINIMSGDILKAYGEDKCMELELLSDDYIVEPIYNKEMLDIFHNTTIYSVKRTIQDYSIVQDATENCLKFNPKAIDVYIYDTVHNGSTEQPDKMDPVEAIPSHRVDYLDSAFDDITPAHVVSMSIMTNILENYSPGNSSTNYARFSSLGTELPHTCRIHTISSGKADAMDEIQYPVYRYIPIWPNNVSDISEAKKTLANQGLLSQFDWAPRVTLVMLGARAWAQNIAQSFVFKQYDLYNYTVISYTDLEKLHNIHVLGGFGLAE